MIISRTTDAQRLVRARRLVTCGAPLLGLLLLPYSLPLEQSFGLWLLFNWRGEITPPDEAIVIGIDRTTEELFGQDIGRGMHADLVNELSRSGASVIAFDVFMFEESEEDNSLAQAVADAGNVILTARLDRSSETGLDVQRYRPPADALANGALGTAPWLLPEVFRVDWAFLRDDSDRPTMPLVVLQAYAFDAFMALLLEHRPDIAASLPASRAGLGPSRTLDQVTKELIDIFEADPSIGEDLRDAGAMPGLHSLLAMYEGFDVFRVNRLYVNYYGPPRTITTIPYHEAYANEFGEGELTGKAVFIGYSALDQPGQEDDNPYVYSLGGFNLSGVEMAATVFANLLHDSYVRLPSIPVRLAIVLSWGALIAIVANRFRVRSGLFIGMALGAGYLLAAFTAFRGATIWLPIVVPGLQLLFAGVMLFRVSQLGDRAQLGIATGEEAALALTGRGKAEKSDHRVVLFADEQGSKKRLRRALAELDAPGRRALQQDFALARDLPIPVHGGRINHTLADSMLAYWATPRRDDTVDIGRQINAACGAALDIHNNIQELNRKYPDFGLALRLGLDWGEIESHLNPSPGIKDWRMEGPPIHAAERLESLNKILGTKTLISDSIATHVDRSKFHTLELGSFIFCDDSGDVVVDTIVVHALQAAETASQEEKAFAEKFASALRALRQAGWTDACAIFEELSNADLGQSDFALQYARWCRETDLERKSQWDGVVMVTFSDKAQYLSRYL